VLDGVTPLLGDGMDPGWRGHCPDRPHGTQGATKPCCALVLVQCHMSQLCIWKRRHLHKAMLRAVSLFLEVFNGAAINPIDFFLLC